MSRPVKTERDKISTKVDGGGAIFLAVKMKDWVTKGVSPTFEWGPDPGGCLARGVISPRAR